MSQKLMASTLSNPTDKGCPDVLLSLIVAIVRAPKFVVGATVASPGCASHDSSAKESYVNIGWLLY